MQGRRPASRGYEIHVRWARSGVEWCALASLQCGFAAGNWVRDIPRARSRESLGWGTVVDRRVLAGREQLLVHFPPSGQIAWLPYEHLALVTSVQEHVYRGRLESQRAERFRLRCLSHALEQWNANTGALSRLDIDPLPHQVSLVHHIIASGNINWLIADDVGLGKTIEVGMLLHALKNSRSFRRILIVCPAGLTRQWQDELADKFAMRDFLIYGRDFEIRRTDHWRLHDQVIASLDRLKQPQHLEQLEHSGPWDLIVFDEAHRLTRRLEGDSLRASERFRLASFVRELTDSMILLTATPHQGRQDLFQALLELVRPDLTDEIRRLHRNRKILHDMVVRNPKSQVTDWHGNRLFHGKSVNAVTVALDEEQQNFGRRLMEYFLQGYQTRGKSDLVRRAVGFVMTIYRKLAASSLYAILRALERRLERLEQEAAEPSVGPDEEGDRRFEGELEEASIPNPAAFFSGEGRLVEQLIRDARQLLPSDPKLKALLERVIPATAQANPDEKLVIFTEYRSTQDYLAQALTSAYGADSVELLNGSMNLEQRRGAIARFNDQARFLISTEAGGEGINLHQRCHTMVNYDLPWNPTRLVQRIGRLYRYGQLKKVVVFNLHAPQTLDADIVANIYQRIDQIVVDLGILGKEFQPGLEDEIFGQLADLVDLESIMEKAPTLDPKDHEQEVEAKLQAARKTYAEQRDLFDYFAHTLSFESSGDLTVGPDHLQAFVQGVLGELKIPIVATRHKGAVLEIRLPEQLARTLGYASHRLQLALTRDFVGRPGFETMDAESPFFQYLLRTAQHLDFEGRAVGCALPGQALMASMLRWQNDQGRRVRQEFALVLGDPERVEINPPEAVHWLLQPTRECDAILDRQTAQALWEVAEGALERRLADVSNQDLHPESLEVLGCALSAPRANDPRSVL